MTIDIKKLRELAEAATPGPWSLDRLRAFRLGDDAEFVHAAQPQAVIALLDEVERFHAALAQRFLDVGELNQQLAAANAEIERLRQAWDSGVAEMTKATYAQVSLVTERLHETEQQLAAMTAQRDQFASDSAHYSEALAAMTQARDEACEIARYVADFTQGETGLDMTPTKARIAELRKVGRP